MSVPACFIPTERVPSSVWEKICWVPEGDVYGVEYKTSVLARNRNLLPDCPVRIPVSTMRQPCVCSQTWAMQVRCMTMDSAVAEDCHISKEPAGELTAATRECLHNTLTLHATHKSFLAILTELSMPERASHKLHSMSDLSVAIGSF